MTLFGIREMDHNIQRCWQTWYCLLTHFPIVYNMWLHNAIVKYNKLCYILIDSICIVVILIYEL